MDYKSTCVMPKTLTLEMIDAVYSTDHISCINNHDVDSDALREIYKIFVKVGSIRDGL